MWHWPIWLTPRGRHKARQRAATLAEAKLWQAEERKRAFGRIENLGHSFDRPLWAAPTRLNQMVRPLLTPGQAARSNRGTHRNVNGS